MMFQFLVDIITIFTNLIKHLIDLKPLVDLTPPDHHRVDDAVPAGVPFSNSPPLKDMPSVNTSPEASPPGRKSYLAPIVGPDTEDGRSGTWAGRVSPGRSREGQVDLA
ncbi:hypothetical protein O1611_g2294 [Lasiodiplodia mahajangana]|uniref:Uncharacterized protein n=1 Tax=Lasiodiplodia mahajangana TaxID=1108764 RepID=A0ACC2JUY9_9PEZI|nr:hypothetical protein O1611_g2294 [Lasiodiplodia mahajangana]